MNSLAFFGFLVCFLILGRSTLGDVIEFGECTDEIRNCEIHEVRINPCKEAPNKPCKFKRGKPAQIEFDFTPNYSADATFVQAYWTGLTVDLPLVGMNTNGCNFTTCPLVQGQRQTFSYQLDISRMFPLNTYDVKWKLEKENTSVNDRCCFVFKIKLTK